MIKLRSFGVNSDMQFVSFPTFYNAVICSYFIFGSVCLMGIFQY